MKKLLFIALAIMMVGCFELNSKQKEERKTLELSSWGETYYTPNGCEYYIFQYGHQGHPIHKQDCKKCADRRKQEMRELIKELGELKSE